MTNNYHVSTTGSDFAKGTQDAPFQTISKAAAIAQTGDSIIVHEGTYREWVKPSNSGYSDLSRITYEAAKGETVIIKGSEIINNWTLLEGNVWSVTLDNAYFGDYNPYATPINGDWFVYPDEWQVHTGEVYLNGKSFYEARTLEDIMNPIKRETFEMPLSGRIEYLPSPQDTLYQWYCDVGNETTTIYANFQGHNPNEELVEINVRKCCFYPEKTGMNYITVRGFEMAQAATPWTPPTADQPGLLGANWSKGWIIENNTIHDSKCSAISIGKEASTGHNLCTTTQQKSGYQYQLEAVFKAYQYGWSKETIGSHIVRNNLVFDCGQNGIVGHMGCVFSEIYNNHIYNIGVKYEFFGWEIAGIKLHAPIDVYIHNNRVHDCTLGLWLDWQAQGTRVSQNLIYNNQRDCTIEVTHGPLIFDNNILASEYNFDNHAQGTAFVNNLFCGKTDLTKILDRATPYHFPHSTQVAGYAFVYNGDERCYNNIYVGGMAIDEKKFFAGTDGYNPYHASYEDYLAELISLGKRDEDKYLEVQQPVYIDGNVYLNGSKAFSKENHNYIDESFNPGVQIIEEGDSVYLEMTLPKDVFDVATKVHSTATLGSARLVNAIYDDANGMPVTIDRDLVGALLSDIPVVGPLQSLVEGSNRIKVWG